MGAQKKNGIKQKLTEIEQLELIRKYQEGLSLAVLATQYDICHESVRHVLQRHNIKRRAFGHVAKIWSDEIKLAILQEYEAGAGCKHLAIKYETSGPTITKIVRENGGLIRNEGRKGSKVTDAQRYKMVDLYATGESTYKIARLLGYDATTVNRHLLAAGVRLKSVGRKENEGRMYTLKQQAFKTLNPDVEYWLGFLLADGNVHGLALSLFLKKSDIGHIELFKQFMDTDRPIMHKKNCVGMSFTSREIVEDLANWGIIPNKSLVADVDVRLRNSPHFWRGMIDGDGWISWDYWSRKDGTKGKTPIIGLCGGSFAILDHWRNYLSHNVGIDRIPKIMTLEKDRLNPLYRLQVKGANCLPIIQSLYANGSNMCLERKHIEANKVIDKYGQ